jgi:hypothetical protein
LTHSSCVSGRSLMIYLPSALSRWSRRTARDPAPLGCRAEQKVAATARQAFMSRTWRGLCFCCTFVDSK